MWSWTVKLNWKNTKSMQRAIVPLRNLDEKSLVCYKSSECSIICYCWFDSHCKARTFDVYTYLPTWFSEQIVNRLRETTSSSFTRFFETGLKLIKATGMWAILLLTKLSTKFDQRWATDWRDTAGGAATLKYLRVSNYSSGLVEVLASYAEILTVISK